MTGTINDDDATPVASISVSAASVAEDGAINLVYSVTLDRASSVNTVIAVGWTGTATAGTDFTGTRPATITVLAGQTTGSTTVTIDPTADTVDEPNETVIATLAAGTGYTISATAGSVTGTITNDDAPTISAARTSALSEEGLVGGIADTTGTTDTTNAVTNTGSFTVTNATSVTLSLPSGSYTSGGAAITWVLSNSNHTLTGSAGGQPVMTVVINDSGSYTTKLLKPIDHPVTTAEDVRIVPITVTAANGAATRTSTLTINVEDDAPTAPATRSVDLVIQPVTTNVAIIVDISSSMSDSDLNLTLQAINTLKTKYDEVGNANINVIQFYGNGHLISGWQGAGYNFTLDNSRSGTDIEQGLRATVEKAFSGNQPASDQNIVYFFGDGDTYDAYQTDFNAYLPTWQTFVQSATVDRLYTYSVNTSSVLADIAKVSVPSETVKSPAAINIANVSTLSSAVAETTGVVQTGNILTDQSGTAVVKYGADGGHIASVTIGAVTVSYDAATPTKIVTGSNGTFTINFLTGDYIYRPTNLTAHQETVTVNVTDKDGDSLNAVLLDINISYASGVGTGTGAPTANTETIITNLASSNAIPDWVLARNDTDPQGDALGVTNRGANRTTDGNFSYTISDGQGNSATTTDAIDFQTGNTLTGANPNEVIVAGSGNNTLSGGGGNDVLVGGAGNDALTGGTGSDTFVWRLADKGAVGTPAADIVTDFRENAADSLDLRDLLQGENHASGAGNLAQYLHFEQVGSNVLLHVSSAGSLTTNGANFAAVQDQTIQLNNVTLANLGGTTDAAIIQNLLTNGKLIVD